ncbi:MAG: hypothetical protein AAFR61_18075 [Bacteroidota bacterium]
MSSLPPQASLDIIRDMIQTARGALKDNGQYLLLWGWLVLIASLAHFVLLVPLEIRNGLESLPWLGLPLIGLPMTYRIRQKHQQSAQVQTHLGRVIAQNWTGIGVCFLLILGVALAGLIDFQVAYPLFIMLYGLGTFLSGQIVRFRPLMWGGIGSWLICIGAFFVPFAYQLLLIALSIVISYLIPGYMLKART